MITDLVAMQENIFHRLMCWERLRSVNIKLERKLRMEVQQDPISKQFLIDPNTVVLEPRSADALVGVGAIVEMPSIRDGLTAGGAPEDVIAFPIVFLENPAVNFTPAADGFNGGTFMSCEEAARLGRRCLRKFFLRDSGEFYDDSTPVRPAPDGEFPNLIAYRVTLLMRMMDENIPTLSLPTIAVDADFNVTLSPPAEAPDASIYYTLDSSFPGASNPAAKLYGAPFPVNAGVVVSWAAYSPQFIPSDVDRATINQ